MKRGMSCCAAHSKTTSAMMMYFISKSHKICHSERNEESAEARACGPNGASRTSTYRWRGRSRRANCPPALTRFAGQRILRCAQNDKFFNIFAKIYP